MLLGSISIYQRRSILSTIVFCCTNFIIIYSGTAFNWFKDYLANRKQYTCNSNGVNSSLSDIVCGVPYRVCPLSFAFNGILTI